MFSRKDDTSGKVNFKQDIRQNFLKKNQEFLWFLKQFGATELS